MWSFLVPGVGLEPTRDYISKDFKSSASTDSAIPASEATMGIEPMCKGFADPCLTTWLRGQIKEM